MTLAIKRRTRVASIFPNTASCLRLVSALLAECNDEWMTGKVYINLNSWQDPTPKAACSILQKECCSAPRSMPTTVLP